MRDQEAIEWITCPIESQRNADNGGESDIVDCKPAVVRNTVRELRVSHGKAPDFSKKLYLK